MLEKDTIDHLQADIEDYISQEPDNLATIQEALQLYDGRLNNVVGQFTPEEVLDFQNYIFGKIPDGQKKEEIAKIKEGFASHYVRDLDDGDIGIIFHLGQKNQFSASDLTRVPIDEYARALWEKSQILSCFNHPLRIKLKRLYEADLKRRYPDGKLEILPPINSVALKRFVEEGELKAFEEFVALIPPGRKVSRKLALTLGAYTVLGPDHVGLPVASETMPDVVGDSTALAALVQCQALGCGPRNNIFSDVAIQAELIRETQTILEESPLLDGREDAKEMLRQWDSNLGILVEPNPYKACKRIEAVLKAIKPGRSLGYVRIYMVEGAEEMIETAQIIMHYFPHLRVYLGQIINENQYSSAQEIGADGVGMGVASGTMCSTAARAGVPPQNINLLYKIRERDARIPIFAETGIPHHAMPIALIAGLTRVNYSAGALGWLDGVGHEIGFRDSKGLAHIYDGEAGPKAKGVEGRNYRWGGYVFLEGVDGKVYYNPDYSTIPHRQWYLSESLALSETFQRYLFHEDLVHDPNIFLEHMSETLVRQVRPYNPF